MDTFSIILVEGISDLAFLSLLISRTHNYSYIEKEDIPSNFPRINAHNCAWYKKTNQYLLICPVGGCDKFNSFYDNYLEPIVKEVESCKNIIVIIDADEKDPSERLKQINFTNIPFDINKYKSFSLMDGFGVAHTKESYLRIIPDEKQGALETIILESIRANESAMVNEAESFVENLSKPAKKHLNRRRLLIKAKTGIVFTLINPEKTFSSLTEKFKDLDFNDSSIVTNFEFLNRII